MPVNPNMPQFGQYASNTGVVQKTVSDKEKQPEGTGFTNLQRILGANATNRLGQTVVSGVRGVGNQAQQGLQKQQAQFGQDIGKQQQHLGQEQELVQGAFGKLDKPEGFKEGDISEGEASGFKNLQNEQYSGPKGLSNADQLQKQSAQAAQYGQLAGSRGGRQELLRTLIGGNNYTAPQQRLDELFLAQSEPALRQASTQQRRIVGQTGKAIQAAQNTAGGQAAALQGLQKQAASGIQSRQGALDTSINERLAAAQGNEQQRQANYEAYKQAVASGDTAKAAQLQEQNKLFDSEQAAALQQLAGAGAGSKFNAMLAGAVNPGQMTVNRGTAAGESDRARVNALAQLAGKTGEFAGYQNPQDVAAGFNKFGGVDANDALTSGLQSKYGFNPEDYQSKQAWNAANNQINSEKLFGGDGRPGKAQELTNLLNDRTFFNTYQNPGANQLFQQALAGQLDPKEAENLLATLGGMTAGNDQYAYFNPVATQISNAYKIKDYQKARDQGVQQANSLMPLLSKYFSK